MSRAVNVRLKLDALFIHPSKLTQREDLKAAAVGQYCAIPRDEPVQPSNMVYQQVAGPQIKVIRVAEYDLRSGLFEHLLRERLDRALCAYGHKGGSFKCAVRSYDAARASMCLMVLREPLK